jgi:hypothetical protein
VDQPTDQLRDRIAAALRVAAHDCSGDCGLPEATCFEEHPIQVSVIHFDQIAGVYGYIDALATVAATAVQPELNRDIARWCLREELEQVEGMYIQRGAENARLRTALASAKRRAKLLHDVREWLMYRGYATRRTPLPELPACAQNVYPAPHTRWLTDRLARLGRANTALVREAKRQARRAEEAERHVRVLLDPGVEYQWRSTLGQSDTVSRQNEELHLEVRRLNAELATARQQVAAVLALLPTDPAEDINASWIPLRHIRAAATNTTRTTQGT